MVVYEESKVVNVKLLQYLAFANHLDGLFIGCINLVWVNDKL